MSGSIALQLKNTRERRKIAAFPQTWRNQLQLGHHLGGFSRCPRVLQMNSGNADSRGQMSFVRTGSADKDQVVGFLHKTGLRLTVQFVTINSFQ
jgi:hypothetical protein